MLCILFCPSSSQSTSQQRTRSTKIGLAARTARNVYNKQKSGGGVRRWRLIKAPATRYHPLLRPRRPVQYPFSAPATRNNPSSHSGQSPRHHRRRLPRLHRHPQRLGSLDRGTSRGRIAAALRMKGHHHCPPPPMTRAARPSCPS